MDAPLRRLPSRWMSRKAMQECSFTGLGGTWQRSWNRYYWSLRGQWSPEVDRTVEPRASDGSPPFIGHARLNRRDRGRASGTSPRIRMEGVCRWESARRGAHPDSSHGPTGDQVMLTATLPAIRRVGLCRRVPLRKRRCPKEVADDTAPLVRPGTGGSNARMGISWIRGTHVSPNDLPARE